MYPKPWQHFFKLTEPDVQQLGAAPGHTPCAEKNCSNAVYALCLPVAHPKDLFALTDNF